ncbi:glycerol-3-phosphate dehydrogenase [NAD(P)+] [Candidatus Magnetoovum chiemensis]|nr:glycerol-3-phosphate dehydrogenase [NAD(P)+] [Candidatus Magnetoovum chiemensis]
MDKLSVIGAGAWGSVLANLLALKGNSVSLWAYEDDVVNEINAKRINSLFLPNIELSANITATASLEVSITDADYIVLVVPSQFVRNVLKQTARFIKKNAVVITAVKGIERGTLKTVSSIISEYVGNLTAVLSGPSFAKEVALKKPTAVTLAVADQDIGQRLQSLFNTDYFRVYTHDDMIGAELGGALKNVIAIAAGIADGLELGLNSRAALITRGLSEMVRLGIRLGAREITFSGLSGLGDLVLTCTGALSRNYTVGVKLGKGLKLNEILTQMNAVAEGIETSASAYELSKRSDVEMPIVTQVYNVIHKNKNPETAVKELMTRQLKKEF